MKLYCVRHGYAEAAGERPLTSSGRQAITKMAQFLQECGLHVSHVMHSEKKRAIETAEILSAHISSPEAMTASPTLDESASIETMLAYVQEWNDDTMLVGHMPFMPQLVSALIMNEVDHNIVSFSPGTIVCLDRFEHQRWILNWVLRPDLLPNG